MCVCSSFRIGTDTGISLGLKHTHWVCWMRRVGRTVQCEEHKTHTHARMVSRPSIHVVTLSNTPSCCVAVRAPKCITCITYHPPTKQAATDAACNRQLFLIIVVFVFFSFPFFLPYFCSKIVFCNICLISCGSEAMDYDPPIFGVS